MKPGDCINIPAEVKHWHGAAPDEWFSHLAIEVPGENGSNEWLEPVSDEEYEKLQQVNEMFDNSIVLNNGVKIPQLCIRHTLQLGAISLPKTGNPEHMKSNAELDFEISAEDMELLKNFKKIKSYGNSGIFPVYGGKM